MKKTNFYPNAWHIPPYPYNMMANGNAEDVQTKDLVLSNPTLLEKNVSEIELNLVRLSAIDNNGMEHFIQDFAGQELVLKGMHTGLFIRTKSTMALAPGKYKRFRFYVQEMGNAFTFADGQTEAVYRFDHLDFEIEGSLTVRPGETPKAIFRFDLVPFATRPLLAPIWQLFRKSGHITTKMANSLGL